MKHRKLLLAALVAVALVGGLAWLILRSPGPPEPVYQGKRLSEWLSLCKGGMPLDPRTVHAVREMGTNAIPTLLRMLGERDSDIKLKLIGLTQKQRLIRINLVSAEQRNWEAVQAFAILGSAASNAVPALIQMYEANRSEMSQQFIARALGGIGPSAKAAVPVLLRNATNSSASIGVRGYSAAALGEIRADPESVVPALVTCLGKNVNPSVQTFALSALVKFGSDANAAVPAIVQLLNSPEPWVKAIAAQALKAIDPEAAAKAGIH